MERLPVVVLAGHNMLINSRIRAVFANYNIKIYEAYNRRELFQIMQQNNNISLLLTDIETDTKNGFDGTNLIRQVKAKRGSLPVVVLTTICKREVITKCLQEGAADYILKPFNDEYLQEKLSKYLDIEKLTEATVLQFNLKNFLEGEIHKARKGNYSFSLLKVQFESGREGAACDLNFCFYQYGETIYSEMKALFWESDLYIRHGPQCHLGFFPFCDQRNRQFVIDKIKARFEAYKRQEPIMRDYDITFTVASYPADGETVSALLHNLSADIKTTQRTA